MTAEVGGFLDYWPTRMGARAHSRCGRASAAIMASCRIETVDLVDARSSPQWMVVKAVGRFTVATHEDANEPYFGVTAAQAITSGLPVYDARRRGALLRSRHAGALPVDSAVGEPRLRRVHAAHRTASAARRSSPQRGSQDQAMFGLGATYSFDMNALW